MLLLPPGELCLHSKEIRLKKESVKKTGKNNAEKNEEKDRDLEKLEKKAVRLQIKEDTDSFSKFDFGISMFACLFL